MSRVVKAPLVISKDETGHDLYLYAGARLPSHIGADEIARLDTLGFLAPEDADASLTPATDPTVDPDEPKDDEPPTS